MSISKQNLLISLACVVFVLSRPVTGWAKARAWEGTIVIPTYGWSQDVNPKFWALEDQIKLSTTVKGAIVYPYPMQDHLSRTKADRTYKALFLENEYLKVTCLPELGGRLHSVLDKTTGEETFHLNRVIKPSMIAMRGAFISGGVEWNAGPQVHTVTIVSPVDALIGTNSDGSAYLEVSNLEQTLRTRWTVRVTLHPGRAYLDEQMRIFNPVDAVNPYYFWNCTAFPCRKGTRFIYPMTLGTDHYGVRFFDWPISQGRDLSWLKNYPEASSIFAVDCTFDFFGGYDVDADRGVVQVADHYELSGKKAWTWGTSDFAMVCQKNLTDEDGAYIEIQSGPLPTQSDYGMLLPRQQVTWREWWYPVHGLGQGFEFATRDLAVQTIREGGNLQLRLLATGQFPGASCVVSRARVEGVGTPNAKDRVWEPGPPSNRGQDARDTGEQLAAKKLNLDPKGPQVVTLSPDPKVPVDVTVKTAKGAILAAFTTPLPIPKTDPPHRPDFMNKPDGQLTVEEKFLKAQKQDLATSRKRAREYYEKALADDAGYAPALRGLAVLDTEAGLYEEAIARLQKAVQRDPGDGVAWYFLGVNYLRTQKPAEALRCAREATRCGATGALAFDLAGRAHAALGEKRAALDAFQKATRMNTRDPLANDHWLLALYAAGDTAAAFKEAQRAVSQDPTDLVPRALLALQGNGPMKSFVKEARDFVGEDDFEMLETSLTFAEMGLTKEAAQLLAAVCVDAVPEKDRSPLPMYYLAWLGSVQKDPEAAKTWLSRAAATPADFVFPSRPEEVEILKNALQENPGDAYACLHLGNLYAHLGRPAEAVAHWQKAADLNKSLSIAHRNLGLYAWAAGNDLSKAEQSYRQAIEARPKDQTLYRDLAEILMAQSKRPEAIKLLESMPSEGLQRAEIIIMLAQAYEDERQYDQAINLLESTPYFVNWEGQTITWDIFHRSHMKRGQNRFESKDFAGALKDFESALTYPDNIGVGRSNRPQEAAAYYWKGKALLALGRLEDARAAWKEGAAGSGEAAENRANIASFAPTPCMKTRRERLMATLRGEPVDRPAVNFYEIGGFDVDPADPDQFNVYHDPSWRPLLQLAEERSDLIQMRSAVRARSWDPLTRDDCKEPVGWAVHTFPKAASGRASPANGEGVHGTPYTAASAVPAVQTHQYTEGEWHCTRVTLRIGGRTLSSTTRRSPAVDTIWTTEHLLKSTDDLKAYLELPDEFFAERIDVAKLIEAEARVGERGIVMVDTEDPICAAASLLSMEDFLTVALTEPALFHLLLDKLSRPLYARTQHVSEAFPGHLWRIYGPEYAAEPFLPPRLFREYVVRYTEPMVRAIKRHGGFARVHCHGRIGAILDLICAMGADATDPIEPPPHGDVSLEYVRRQYGDRLVLFGNIELSDIESMEPPEFERLVAQTLIDGTRGQGRGFVLMPSSAPNGRQITARILKNYETMVRLAEAFRA